MTPKKKLDNLVTLSIYFDFLQAIRQWDQALRERNEYRDALSKVQRQHEEAVKDINQAMAVRIKVGRQSRISARPWRSGSRWGTVKDINQAMAVRIKVGGQSRISTRPWWSGSR